MLTPALIHDKKIAILWSAKSGCTLVWKWYFNSLGILEEALNFSSNKFIHDYRMYFTKLDSYKKNYEYYLNNYNEYTTYKVIRNPYKRAVSSYIQAVKYHYEDKQISKLTKRDVLKTGFSFEEFISYLETLDIENCNVHYLQQYNDAELKLKVKIIDLDQISTFFDILYLKHNIVTLDKSYYSSFHHIDIDLSKQDFCGYYRFVNSRSYPEHIKFYNKDLINRVEKIYKKDFFNYYQVK
jgi:hypothetical protein